jgi:hypothetical protein
MVSKVDRSSRSYDFLIDPSIRRRVKVNAGDCNPVGVPGDTTTSGLESRVKKSIEAHDIGKVCVGLAQRNCKVSDV